jgi:hypothetical protein
MRTALRMLLLASLLGSAAGCATGATGATGEAGAPRARVRQDLLTREQIQASRATNTYDVVQSMRSSWLRERSNDSLSGSGTKVQVYFDDRRMGGVENLRSIPLPQVAYIRWYDGTAASGRWGLGHGQGVIYVSSQPLDEGR